MVGDPGDTVAPMLDSQPAAPTIGARVSHGFAIVFECVETASLSGRGARAITLYSVLNADRAALFTGEICECERFLAIYLAKLAKARDSGDDRYSERMSASYRRGRFVRIEDFDDKRLMRVRVSHSRTARGCH